MMKGRIQSPFLFAKGGHYETFILQEYECKVLVDNIKDNIRGIEDDIDLDKTLNCSAINVIWNLVAEQRYLHDDQKMKDLVKFVGRIL